MIKYQNGCLWINLLFLTGQLVKSAGWIRFLGRGFAYKDTKVHSLLFSERNGYTKRVQIGKWSMKLLTS
jgi:hypothetical protein